MATTFTLVDLQALADLQVFLGRAERVQDGSVRLIAGSSVLAVYVSVLHPAGLLDDSPTVLGLRTFALTGTDPFDVVVPVRSLRARVDAAEVAATTVVTVPLEVTAVNWAGIAPPKGGWKVHPSTRSTILDAAARAGINEVAAAIPVNAGEQIVRTVRTEIWGRAITGLDFLPAGAAFAALSLGFLAGDEPVAIYESGAWTRLTTARGHVLVKRKAWTLAR